MNLRYGMKGVFLALLMVVLLLAIPAQAAGTPYVSHSLVISVYPDGVAQVTQRLVVSQSAQAIEVPLVSTVGSSLVATDQNGAPLSYGFQAAGSNITLYTLGATGVTLTYTTDGLTSKNGTVWTLVFTSAFNATVVLPRNSTLSFVSGTPSSINVTGGYPEATVTPGHWTVGYGVSLAGVTGGTTATTTTTAQGGFGLGATPDQEYLVGGGLAAAVGIVAVAWLWRRRGRTVREGDLRPDDLQVLQFIQEKGGKVMEPEIRMKFALPKTSGWRMIKRLERMGYVKVTKVGTLNQIEYVKNRDSQG